MKNSTTNVFKLIKTFLFIRNIYVFWFWRFKTALCTLTQSLCRTAFNTNPIPYDLGKGSRLLKRPAKSVNLEINSLIFRVINLFLGKLHLSYVPLTNNIFFIFISLKVFLWLF